MRSDKKYSGDARLMRSHFSREINIGLIMFCAERSTWGPSEGKLPEKIEVPVRHHMVLSVKAKLLLTFDLMRQDGSKSFWYWIEARPKKDEWQNFRTSRQTAVRIPFPSQLPSSSPSKIEIYEINFPGISQFLSLNLKQRKCIKMCWLLYDA